MKPLNEKAWKGETGAFTGKVYLNKDVKDAVEKLKKAIVPNEKFVCGCCVGNKKLINEIFGDLK